MATKKPISREERERRLRVKSEDQVFEGLIQTYTQQRDWDMVRTILTVFLRVLEDREGVTT